MKSLVAAGMHYIRTADGLEELYVLNSDPEERVNLAGSAVRPRVAPAIPSRPRGDAQEAVIPWPSSLKYRQSYASSSKPLTGPDRFYGGGSRWQTE